MVEDILSVLFVKKIYGLINRKVREAMNLEEAYKEQEEVRKSYENEKGELLGYIGHPCCNCQRIRVEIYDNGNLICEKCGTDQKTKKLYENEFGSWNEFDNI